MQIVQAVASFTRPSDTTAYASGDLVANSTTAGSVSPMAFAIPYGRAFEITRVTVSTAANITATGADFKLHLFRDSPTVSAGDNSAIANNNSANYIGQVDITSSTGTSFPATAGLRSSALTVPMIVLADMDQVIFGLLEARGAYVPTSAEVITVTVMGRSYV